MIRHKQHQEADPIPIIQNRLSAIQWRMQSRNLFGNLASCGFWGILLVGMVLSVNRFIRLPLPITPTVVLLLAGSMIVAVALTLSRKTDRFAVARFVDQRLNLKARFSTALESIEHGRTGNPIHLQLCDTANFAEDIVLTDVVPYRFPPMFIRLAVPAVLVGLSFAVPYQYAVPPPPTALEQKAIQDTATELEGTIKGIDDPELATEIQAIAEKLKKADVQKAQTHLRKLRDAVDTRKAQLSDAELTEAVKAIEEGSEATQHFKGMSPGDIAAELEKLEQDTLLSPELQAELHELFKQLAERLEDNPTTRALVNQLATLETQAVSAEMLEKIKKSLLEIDQKSKRVEQLEQLANQIKASQKNIALAGIEVDRQSSGGTADSGSGPGEDMGDKEVQGTVAAGGADFEPRTTSRVEEAPLVEQSNESTKRHTAINTPPGDATSPTLTLKDTGSESESTTTVFVGTDETAGGDEPAYLPYSKAILNTKQAYANAIENNQIPVRYRKQIQDYLNAISKP